MSSRKERNLKCITLTTGLNCLVNRRWRGKAKKWLEWGILISCWANRTQTFSATKRPKNGTARPYILATCRIVRSIRPQHRRSEFHQEMCLLLWLTSLRQSKGKTCKLSFSIMIRRGWLRLVRWTRLGCIRLLLIGRCRWVKCRWVKIVNLWVEWATLPASLENPS